MTFISNEGIKCSRPNAKLLNLIINFTLPLLMKQCLENFLCWTLCIFSIFWTVDTHCFLSACMGWVRLWCKLLKIVVVVFIQSLNELLILCCFIVEAYLAKLFRRFSTVRFWRMKLVRKVPMSLHKSGKKHVKNHHRNIPWLYCLYYKYISFSFNIH